MGLFITYHQNVFPMESWDSWGAYVVMDVFLLSRVLSHSVICMNLLCSLVIKSNLQLVRFSSLTGVTLIFIILCLVPGNEYTGSSRFAGRQTVQCKGHWNTARIPAFWHFLYHLQVPDAEIMLKQLRFGETFPDLAASSPISCGVILLLSAPVFPWVLLDEALLQIIKQTKQQRSDLETLLKHKHTGRWNEDINIPRPPPPSLLLQPTGVLLISSMLKSHVFHQYHPIWITLFLLFKPTCFCTPLFLAFLGLWRSVMTKVPS